ncbi:MAG: solute:sodium symporter family transporter, partial [Pseudomonadota bacterium]
SVLLALLSFVIAPLLMFAPDGLWQIIRLFTGFYNIPVITIVLVGLFTRRVPALGAKLAIVFHVLAYGGLNFVWKPDLHFIHSYAVLFLIELALMLWVGRIRPRAEAWRFARKPSVELIPWRFALPCALVLGAAIVALYLVFSPIGLVGGAGTSLTFAIAALLVLTTVLCWWSLRAWRERYTRSIGEIGR